MRNRRRGAVYVAIVAVVFAASVIPAFSQTAAQVSDAGAAKTSSNDEVSLLKRDRLRSSRRRSKRSRQP